MNDHGYATGIVRQDDGKYEVECWCGDQFTDISHQHVRATMRQHLDLFEEQTSIDLGRLSVADVLRLRDSLALTAKTADDVVLLAHLRLRIAKFMRASDGAPDMSQTA